jgi:hypothetical protein
MIGDQLVVGVHQLGPHQDRQRATDDAGEDREANVKGADVLVVGREKPAREEARPMIMRRVIGADRVSIMPVSHRETSS